VTGARIVHTISPMPASPVRARALRAALLLAAASVTALVPACGDPGSPPPPSGARPGGTLSTLPLQTVGGKVNLGAVKPCGGDAKGVGRIRNQSSAPVEILAYSTNCGCLSAHLTGDRVLKPGEEREVELTVHPNGRGDRSISVLFGTAGGAGGSMRVDFSLNDGVQAVPGRFDVIAGNRDVPVDVVVKGSDGRPVKVIAIDPPIGSVEPSSGPDAKVVLSTYEALRFVESEAGRVHPGVLFNAPGKAQSLTVSIVTDHPDCPTATFDFVFGQ
jgi:Protein of unknown function (DUF1573)